MRPRLPHIVPTHNLAQDKGALSGIRALAVLQLVLNASLANCVLLLVHNKILFVKKKGAHSTAVIMWIDLLTLLAKIKNIAE